MSEVYKIGDVVDFVSLIDRGQAFPEEPDPRWFIAVTNPNCHRRAEAELAALGYRAFWPRLRKWVTHARVKTAKEYPILGRYLFVQVHDGNFWRVRSVNGVEALLTGDNGAPAEVPERIVMDFQARYHAGEWDFVANGILPIGARVRIIEGEFANMLVVVRGRRNGKIQFFPTGSRKEVSIREEKAWAA